jgi:hypothetical protein
MPSGFSKSDLDSLFDTDGVAVAGRIFTADENGEVAMTEADPPVPVFLRNLNVIFTEDGQEVDLYGDTRGAVTKPSFLAKRSDLSGVVDGMIFDMPALESHEDGYGESYKVAADVIPEGVQTMRVNLRKS